MRGSTPDGARHENLGGTHRVERSSDRSFGMVFAGFFTIVALWPLLDGLALRYWALAVATGFLAVALMRPKLLAPLNDLWMRFGLLLNKIVSPFVMGLVFFLVVTPIGVTMRLLGKAPLNLKSDPDARSYWIERDPPGPGPETMRQQF